MADLHPSLVNHILIGGSPVIAIPPGSGGALIQNPPSASGQGIPAAEELFYDLTGLAAAFQTNTTFPIQPGNFLQIPAGDTRAVSLNAVTTGHKFSAFYIGGPTPPPPAFTPIVGPFPPNGPTTLQNVVKAYPYVQYQDDDDIWAFFRAANNQTQAYVDWFNQINLPVYTGPLIAGTLLDWVALGLYGMKRPTLSSGRTRTIGPYNTTAFNTLAYNVSKRIGPNNVSITTDDIFKRIMTWNLYRGDGRQFNLMWLKRRIVRFLNGANGTDPVIQDTYDVSAFYASRTQINIVLPVNVNSEILKEAIDSAAVNLPLQVTFSVSIA